MEWPKGLYALVASHYFYAGTRALPPPVRRAAMAAASSADFDAKLKSWGLEAKMVEYLSELGLNSACAVAHAAVQDSELLEQVIVPFEQGVQIGDKTYKVEGVPIKWRVAMRHAWAECRKAEAPTPPASSAAAAAPAPAAAAPAPLSRRSKTELEPGEFEQRASA